MGYSKVKSSALINEQVESNVQEFLLDTPEDISSITEDCAPGSIAYTADMSYIAILDNNGNWIQPHFN